MESIKGRVKGHHIVSAFAVVGVAFVALNFSHPPLFNSSDPFVLFGTEGILLSEGTQISSGDLGSNKDIDIDKDALINGNLFADRIDIDKNSTINGNASYNKLQLQKDVQILGTTTTPVSLPIANLPAVVDFPTGTQNLTFSGTSTSNTLSPGNYRDIVLEKNSKLVLVGGIYNLRKLVLKENTTLIYNLSTTLNIQFKLRGYDRVSILPGGNTKPDDLQINYLGIKPKKEKDTKEEDDDEINALHDDKEKKDYQAGKIGRPVLFGKESFLNFRLLSHGAKVQLEKESTIRGQVLARKIRIGKDGIVSREEVFAKESDPGKVVESQELKFVVNELLVLFTNGATQFDAQSVAESVGGKITGFIPVPKIYKIKVPTQTATELNDKVQIIKNSNNPLIVEVVQNLVSQ